MTTNLSTVDPEVINKEEIYDKFHRAIYAIDDLATILKRLEDPMGEVLTALLRDSGSKFRHLIECDNAPSAERQEEVVA